MTIGIEHVNDYPLIRFEIRFERKFLIRSSLLYTALPIHASCAVRPTQYAPSLQELTCRPSRSKDMADFWSQRYQSIMIFRVA